MAEPPVVNASPLIFLARGDLLDLLQLAGDTVVVTTSVATEIRRRGPADLTAQAIQNTAWVVLVEDPPIPGLIQAWDLGQGESSVLAWAYTHLGTGLSSMIWPPGAAQRHSGFLCGELWGLSSQQRGAGGFQPPDLFWTDYVSQACTCLIMS